MHALAKELTKLLDKYDFFFLCFLHVIINYIFLTKSKKSIVDRKVKEDSNLDIFEMTTNTSEPTMKLINKELLIFKRYQVNVENIKSPPQWWEKWKNMFPTIGFCARQILEIVGFQIEMERIFSLAGILTNLLRDVAYNQKIWTNWFLSTKVGPMILG